MKLTNVAIVVLGVCTIAHATRADGVIIQTVPVGNLGNAPELSGAAAGGEGPTDFCGYVDHDYAIGKYEITAGQYTAFLNAVATTDTHGLYNTAMWSDAQGCHISRGGSPGSYVYAVDPDWADRPVNLVSWGDAARFCNWLHNGQPTGAQDLGTTEDGSYLLNGASSNSSLMAVERKAGATWVIPTEDEWYKAAYHANDGATGNYFDYPAGSDAVPANVVMTPDPGNNGNFFDTTFSVSAPYYRTPVGTFSNSASPYGTFDQGGNVWEWNEEVVSDADRGARGGSFASASERLHASTRSFALASQESVGIGFRIARVGADPVPAASQWGVGALALLVLTAGTLCIREWS
ncbi:MAG: SUMF1/EgtB/PvdO family nonheme iron enzyme [Phycisphaerae bacterium]|nr:SUMF1/EgtB/PvdO family nonheme iron enzyme [Phycisphaerae bacterium]